MEWVETTGSTVEEAREQALDQLGVLEEDAEFEVLEEPKQGMFGRTRGAARVRARVAPSAPPPKQERRRRDGRGRDGSRKAGSDRSASGSGERTAGASRTGKDTRSTTGTQDEEGSDRDGANDGRATDNRKKVEREMMPETEQRGAGEEFLGGLMDAFGYEGGITSSLDEDGILSFEVGGDGLGLLIGPGLNTLDAVQEVCRNAIQRQADGREYGKVVLDVAGARTERTLSLEAFVRTEAEAVLETGDDVIFDVMSRADRKIVHDVVAEFDGLVTESIGEDPRRRVVLRPA